MLADSQESQYHLPPPVGLAGEEGISQVFFFPLCLLILNICEKMFQHFRDSALQFV